MRIRARIRWWIAETLDRRRPATCWADLASWAMRTDGYRLRDAARPRRSTCQRDIDDNGGCWCGKVRAPIAQDATTHAQDAQERPDTITTATAPPNHHGAT